MLVGVPTVKSTISSCVEVLFASLVSEGSVGVTALPLFPSRVLVLASTLPCVEVPFASLVSEGSIGVPNVDVVVVVVEVVVVVVVVVIVFVVAVFAVAVVLHNFPSHASVSVEEGQTFALFPAHSVFTVLDRVRVPGPHGAEQGDQGFHSFMTQCLSVTT